MEKNSAVDTTPSPTISSGTADGKFGDISSKNDGWDIEKVVSLKETRLCDTKEVETNPNIVDWDVDDPERGLNWSALRKWKNIAMLATLTFLTYASSPVAIYTRMD